MDSGKVASGKTRWFQERLCGFRLGGCFRKWFQDSFGGVRKVWGGSRKSCVVSGKAAWFQERLRGFRKGCVVSGGVVWFPARLWGHTKVCVAYDVGSLMVKG